MISNHNVLQGRAWPGRSGRASDRRVGAVVLTLLCASVWGCADVPEKPYNVLLITVDTLRADRMSLYGAERETTPFMQELSATSTVFGRHLSQAGCTFPSVNSMLTSRPAEHFLDRASEYGMVIPEDTTSLPEIFVDEDYVTMAVSTSSIVRKTPSINQRGGYDRGFMRFDESCEIGSAACVNQVVLEALDGRSERLRERPFFLYLHYLEPHSPYRPPKTHEFRWAGPAPDRRWVRRGEGHTLMRNHYSEGGARFTHDHPYVQHLLDLYDEEIRYFDDSFRDLLGALEERGILDDTIVMLVSDHGEEFLEHDQAAHCRDIAYQTNLWVPWIVQLPARHPLHDAVAGGRIDQLSANLDVAPTLLGLLGWSERPEAEVFEGVDFSALWRGVADADEPLRRYVAAAQGTNRVLRVGDWKIIVDLETDAVELYDLATDPGETQDLSSREPERLAQLREAVERYLASVDRSAAAADARELERTLERLGYL